jgi:hypothetical protein
MNRYLVHIRRLGGIAIILFAVAFVFANVVLGALPDNLRRSVLIQAIPFFTTFVGILLLFILSIILMAERFNGAIPSRTYKNVEALIVAGIIFGVICLFNPWSVVPYRYGFGLLLISTLLFIVWSHISPPRAQVDAAAPPISSLGHIAGVVVALAIMALIISSAITTSEPREPYGIRDRVWNTYSEERRAEIANAATTEFTQVEIPFIIIFSLFPGVLGYLLTRELAGGTGLPQSQPSRAAAGD